MNDQEAAIYRKESLGQKETLDSLGQGRYIIQPKRGFRFSLDAVLLAHFVRLRRGKKDCLLDLGSGTGILPFLLAGEAAKAVGIEIDAQAVDMARRSLALNDFAPPKKKRSSPGEETPAAAEKISFLIGDYREKAVLDRAGREAFDVVVANPPYFSSASGKSNALAAVNDARHETKATLNDVCRAAAYTLRYGGSFFLIYISDRLAAVFSALEAAKLEAKRLRFIAARSDTAPTLFLLEAKKGAKPGLKVMPLLIVHDENGDLGYSAEVAAYYQK